MEKRRKWAVGGLLLAIVVSSFAAVSAAGQTSTTSVQEVTSSAIDQALTFIDSASTYLGRGVLYVLNVITDNRVSPDLTKPIGYLTFITVVLLLFGLLDFARKIIWVGIIVGWVLLIVRIILDALNL